MRDRRKRRAAELFGILIALAVSFFVFRGSRGQNFIKSGSEITRVAVILPHKNDGYWELIKGGIDEAGEELGKAYGIDIQTVVPQLNYNISQMQELVRQEIAAKVDVLVIQGNENKEYLKTLRAAWESGIKIICVDTDIRDFPEHLYIGTDNYEAGQMIGRKLAELTGGAVKAAVVSGEPEYLNLEERLQGLQDAVKEYPEISLGKVYYDHYDGLTAMHLYHELSSKADAIVFLEGTGGTTLSAGFRKPEDYEYVLGFDAYENVKKGSLDGIVKQDTVQMGHRVVEEIAHYIENGSYSADQIYTDINWVTADNYEEVMR